MKEEDFIILVDSQRNSNVEDFIGNEVATIAIILPFKTEYYFEDIRPEIGACSSIIASYFVENNIQFKMLPLPYCME